MQNERAKFRPDLLILLGEETSDDLRIWANQLIHRPGYAGPVQCASWLPDPLNIITGETALHAVDILFHAVAFMLFYDWTVEPPDEDAEVKRMRIRQYLAENRVAINHRANDLFRKINASEWFNLLALASVELEKLLQESAPVMTGREVDEIKARQYTPDKIPKGLIKHELKLSNDEAFNKLINNDPLLIHPDHGKRDRDVRFDQDALVNTDIYNPSMRSAAIAKWNASKKKKPTGENA